MSVSDRYGSARFGLPEAGTLLGETPDFTKAREEAVRKLVADVFGVAEAHLGEVNARRLWADTPPKLKRGAKTGSRDDERDNLLLALYDYVLERGEIAREAIPPHLGGFLSGKCLPISSAWRCQTAEAVEVMIRRLLHRRAEAKAAVRDQGETLLGSAKQELPG